MVESADSLVLEHLCHIRKAVDTIQLDIIDLKSRASAVEQIQGQLLTLLGGLGQRMDRSDERLACIERRLDLVEV